MTGLPHPISWLPGDLILYGAAVLVALGVLRRALRKPRHAVKHFFRESKAAVFDIRGWPPVIDPHSGRELKPAIPGIASRVENIESTLGFAGRIDQLVTELASNRDLLSTIERRSSEAAVLAGESAQVAARADQRARDLRDEGRTRHEENLNRFRILESQIREALEQLHQLRRGKDQQ